MGMAVDANVLVFERIREELRRGRNVMAAIEGGYQRAISTIIDPSDDPVRGTVPLRLWFRSDPWFCRHLAIGIVPAVDSRDGERMLIIIWLERKRPRELVLRVGHCAETRTKRNKDRFSETAPVGAWLRAHRQCRLRCSQSSALISASISAAAS